MASNIDNPDHVDPNFPTSIEEVEERLKAGDAMTCEEAAACQDDEIAPDDEFSPEDHELVHDVLKIAAVRLQIHRDADKSEGGQAIMEPHIDEDLSNVSTGWNWLYNKRFVNAGNKYTSPYIDFLPSGSEIFPDRFDIALACGFIRRMRMQTPRECDHPFAPNREFIILRSVTGDLESANTSCKVKEGASDERAYILLDYLRQPGVYKFDRRPSLLELFAIIPESLARRLDEAIKRNKKFRIFLMRELMQGTFPFLRGKEGDEYGVARFDKDFTYVGPDVELRPLPAPQPRTNIRPNTDPENAGSASSSGDEMDDIIGKMKRRNRIDKLQNRVAGLIVAVGVLAGAGVAIKECGHHDQVEAAKP